MNPVTAKRTLQRRGDEIRKSHPRPQVETGNHGKMLAIDIETEALQIDASEIGACSRLEARHPDAQIRIVRIGSRLRRFGGRTFTQDAIVDTGFNGWLSLPPNLITQLNLR